MSKLKTIGFYTIIGFLVVFFILVGASVYVGNYFKSKVVAPPVVVPVNVIQIDNQNYNGTIKSSGFVKASQTGNLFVLQAGRVANIYVQPGQKVKKGQLILALDTSAEQAQIAAQQANLQAAKTNADGLAAVYKAGGVSKVQVEQARAAYNQLLSSIQAAQEALKNKRVVAPFDATVGTINIAEGDMAQPGVVIASVQPLATIQDVSYVNLSVSPAELKQLAVGNQAKALSENGELIAIGTITSLDTSVSKQSGLSKVRVDFKNTQSLNDGMFVKVDLQANQLNDRIIIPDIAINYTLYGQTIYSVVPLDEDDKTRLTDAKVDLAGIYKVREKFVKSNTRTNDIALIDSGLDVGDIIITQGNDIRDGSFVKIAPGYGLGIPNSFKLPVINTDGTVEFKINKSNLQATTINKPENK